MPAPQRSMSDGLNECKYSHWQQSFLKQKSFWGPHSSGWTVELKETCRPRPWAHQAKGFLQHQKTPSRCIPLICLPLLCPCLYVICLCRKTLGPDQLWLSTALRCVLCQHLHRSLFAPEFLVEKDGRGAPSSFAGSNGLACLVAKCSFKAILAWSILCLTDCCSAVVSESTAEPFTFPEWLLKACLAFLSFSLVSEFLQEPVFRKSQHAS